MSEPTYIEWRLLKFMLVKRQPGERAVCRVGKDGHASITHAWDREVTKVAKAAALTAIKKGYLVKFRTVEHWGDDYELSATGVAIAEGPAMTWTPPKPPKLTERDWNVLHNVPVLDGKWTTQDCGGTNGSHHSTSLKKLACHGLITTTASSAKYPHPPTVYKRAKGSNRWCMTDTGRAEYARRWPKSYEIETRKKPADAA